MIKMPAQKKISRDKGVRKYMKCLLMGKKKKSELVYVTLIVKEPIWAHLRRTKTFLNIETYLKMPKL